ncbi:hypothetical protein G9U51_08450 [Calidifontibacter sp. DB0510]|uniref:Uncharacterized protein n=1 Tax=Metallococcus carri TaxID=1656884 RepID=A0A967AZ73_9MICO|nr:hypothetical protein [Metallococcus carri]NHN55806.1 hypothetical protein [Metallococcus carri]NOP38506.1 hypothetical protein [Calidifontibacter sp. DB2511S]
MNDSSQPPTKFDRDAALATLDMIESHLQKMTDPADPLTASAALKLVIADISGLAEVVRGMVEAHPVAND